MYAAGARFVEAGPGRVLTQLVGKVRATAPPRRRLRRPASRASGGPPGARRLAAIGIEVDPDVLLTGPTSSPAAGPRPPGAVVRRRPPRPPDPRRPHRPRSRQGSLETPPRAHGRPDCCGPDLRVPAHGPRRRSRRRDGADPRRPRRPRVPAATERPDRGRRARSCSASWGRPGARPRCRSVDPGVLTALAGPGALAGTNGRTRAGGRCPARGGRSRGRRGGSDRPGCVAGPGPGGGAAGPARRAAGPAGADRRRRTGYPPTCSTPTSTSRPTSPSTPSSASRSSASSPSDRPRATTATSTNSKTRRRPAPRSRPSARSSASSSATSRLTAGHPAPAGGAATSAPARRPVTAQASPRPPPCWPTPTGCWQPGPDRRRPHRLPGRHARPRPRPRGRPLHRLHQAHRDPRRTRRRDRPDSDDGNLDQLEDLVEGLARIKSLRSIVGFLVSHADRLTGGAAAPRTGAGRGRRRRSRLRRRRRRTGRRTATAPPTGTARPPAMPWRRSCRAPRRPRRRVSKGGEPKPISAGNIGTISGTAPIPPYCYRYTIGVTGPAGARPCGPLPPARSPSRATTRWPRRWRPSCSPPGSRWGGRAPARRRWPAASS